MSSFLPEFVSNWMWPAPPKTQKATDAIRSPIVRHHFYHFMEETNPPASFKAADVAKELSYNELVTLGYETWRDAVPAIIELAFELREEGSCEIIKQGKVLGEDVSAYDVEGACRIRKTTGRGPAYCS